MSDCLLSDVTVRAASPDDAAAFVGVYSPYVLNTAISFEEDVPSVEDMKQRVLRTTMWTPWLTAVNGVDIIGYAYAVTHRERAAYRWAVDTSIYIHERFRGRGVGSRLYGLLFRILERQGFQRACAGITLPNDASVGLHRAFGFAEVGVYHRIAWKLSAWRDVVWLERDIGGPLCPPPDPIPFSSLCKKDPPA